MKILFAAFLFFLCVVVGRFCLSMYEVIRLGYFIGFHLLI